MSCRQGEALGMLDGLLMSIAFETKEAEKKHKWDRYRDLTFVLAVSLEHPLSFFRLTLV